MIMYVRPTCEKRISGLEVMPDCSYHESRVEFSNPNQFLLCESKFEIVVVPCNWIHAVIILTIHIGRSLFRNIFAVVMLLQAALFWQQN